MALKKLLSYMMKELSLVVNEIWKDIEDYEGLYKISNLGRVKTLGRQRVKEGIKKTEICKGYERLILSKNKKQKHYFIHRLVAKAFIPNPNNLKIINHKDENKLNNNVENLEWCTQRYNLCYGDRRQKVIDKERKPVNQYDKNNNLIEIHYSIQQAARNIGRNAGPICRCCQGKQEYAYDCKWSYANESEVV